MYFLFCIGYDQTMQNILPTVALTFFAGLSTVIGGIIVVSIPRINKSLFVFLMGLSAGAMIYLSLVEFLPSSTKVIGPLFSFISFFFGIALIGIIDSILPAHYEKYCQRKGKTYDSHLVTGWFVAFALAVHNIPEGIAVMFSSLGDMVIGISLAVATAIHNIPEGVAIATPVYKATGRKIYALGYTAVAGLAEPIGALLFYFLLKDSLSPYIIHYIFAFVAGIMVYISFDELLPSCLRQGQDHYAIAGVMTGMLIIAGSLYILH